MSSHDVDLFVIGAGSGGVRGARIAAALQIDRIVKGAVAVVAGRDASANFDMQSLASLMHGDQVRVRRSAKMVRFLHPRGWSYYATLRRKLRWYEGVV